ncbi:hypothetical protein [uncultured Aquimarina sp.]|uniref:hypothetical protein n=1 Tax=uncultured Aquimarina sp. TaxID=575652 RepID=UPI002616A41B|nr:hypothetical protein [uncultured Aquimarina sp.]
MNDSLTELLEIILSGDKDKCSFHVINNFERFHNEFDFLHKRIGVETAIEKILQESKDEKLINFAINKIGESDKYKYVRRNYILILADLFLEKNNLTGLEVITAKTLKDEFKFRGYRKLLLYYSKNYDEKKFLETFKKIEKRNTLMPIDKKGINRFIEKYSSIHKDINQVKDLIRKKRIYPKVNLFITPMIIGYFGNREDFQEIENIVTEEMENEYDYYSYIEIIYNELYERSDKIDYKLKLLLTLEDLCERTPKDIKVKGYPSKLWTLLLWRVGCKYLDLNKKEKVEQIIKKLTGKNKSSLKDLYGSKYN